MTERQEQIIQWMREKHVELNNVTLVEAFNAFVTFIDERTDDSTSHASRGSN